MKIIETFPEQPTEQEVKKLAAFVRIKKQAAQLCPEDSDRQTEAADKGRNLLHSFGGSTDTGK